jgi:hypothetical protein
MRIAMLQRPLAALLAGTLFGATVLSPGPARAQAVPGATLAVDNGASVP